MLLDVNPDENELFDVPQWYYVFCSTFSFISTVYAASTKKYYFLSFFQFMNFNYSQFTNTYTTGVSLYAEI